MSARWSDVCLVFAATENFLPGAVVGIASFLKHHPRFGGDIVFFHDGLPGHLRETLETAFPPLRFQRVSAELEQRLARLGKAWPAMRRKLPDFYSLEAFRMGGFRKVFYCDCDLLFLRPVGELFESGESLLCCGDTEFMKGWCHDADTYRPIESPAQAGPGGALERTFSCGVLLIDGRLTGEPAYAELVELVDAESWRGTETVHSDQFLLNRRFAGRQTLVSSTYNFRLHLADAIRAREGLRARDAHVLHFTGPVKPWMPDRMMRLVRGDRSFPPGGVFELWYEAWMECLASGHLRAVARAGRSEAAERATA